MYKKILLTGLSACALAMFSQAPLAATSWTMAVGYPDHSFFTENVKGFIDEIEEKSDGELTIKLFSNGSLVKLDSIKRAVRSGQVDAGEVRLGVYSNEDPMYGVDNIPGLTDQYSDSRILSEVQKPYFDELLAGQGMMIVSFIPWPGQGFYSNTDIQSLDDLKGKKIRMYSKGTSKMAKKLDMVPTILPFEEVPQALSTGLVESLWTSPQTGNDIQAWDYLKYFSYTGSEHNRNAILINKRAFDALDENLQKIVLEAGENASTRGEALSKKAQEDTMANLEKHGMVVADAPAEVVQRIDEIGQEDLAEWRETATPEQNRIIDEFLEARQ